MKIWRREILGQTSKWMRSVATWHQWGHIGLDRPVTACCAMPSFLSSNFLTPEEQSPVLGKWVLLVLKGYWLYRHTVRTPSLPNELLILVLSHLNEKRDLAALSLTCQTFRSILEPQLYSRIDILFPNTTTPQTSMEQEPSLNGPRRAALCRTLVSPHYSSLVTSFNFVSPICNQDIRREFQEWWTRLPDKCDEIDAQLSNVLQALPNLHTLLVEFRACWTSNPEKRHRYLQNLKTRTLTSLSFKCYCSAEPLSQTYETLSSPCCQAIHSLKWERASKHARGGQQEFDVSRILPPLQKLGYVENKILDKLLSCRAITHLACEIWDDTRHRAFCKGPSNGTLTWLCTRVKTREVYEGDLSHLPNLSVSGRYLAIGVGDNPEAFKNVTHLGDLFFFFADVRSSSTVCIQLRTDESC